VVTVAAASESVLICVDPAAAARLAEMAAAAIASGAVALPDAEGEVVGTLVKATVTGIATATTFGVVTDVAPCCAVSAGSGVEVSSEDDLAVDFAAPAFTALEFAPERCTALVVLAPELASEGGWLVLLSEGWLALGSMGWFELGSEGWFAVAWLLFELLLAA